MLLVYKEVDLDFAAEEQAFFHKTLQYDLWLFNVLPENKIMYTTFLSMHQSSWEHQST